MKLKIGSGDYGYLGQIPDDLFTLGADVELTIRGRVIEVERDLIDVTPSYAAEPETIEGERIIWIEVAEIRHRLDQGAAA